MPRFTAGSPDGRLEPGKERKQEERKEGKEEDIRCVLDEKLWPNAEERLE